MAYTTISTKYVICPLQNTEVSLQGHYLFSEEKGHTYEAKFLSATCPIVENIRLPKSKRDKKYELFQFCNVSNCELLKDFKPVIDVRKGYSQ